MLVKILLVPWQLLFIGVLLFGALSTAQPVSPFLFGAPGTNASVGFEGCAFNECPVGRLMADAALAWCGSVSTCHLALLHAAETVSDIPAGTSLSAAALVPYFPLGSNLTIVTLTGARLFEILQQSVAVQPSPGFLHVAGLMYSCSSIPPRRLGFVDVTSNSMAAALLFTATYNVVTSTTLLGAASPYPRLRSGATVVLPGPSLVQAVAAYALATPQALVALPSRAALQLCMQPYAGPLDPTLPLLLPTPRTICRVVATTGAACPTNLGFCQGQGDPLNVRVVFCSTRRVFLFLF